MSGQCEKWMMSSHFRSTPHRVKNTADRDRLSFPFFFDPNFAAVVEPIQLSEMHLGLVTRREDDGWGF